MQSKTQESARTSQRMPIIMLLARARAVALRASVPWQIDAAFALIAKSARSWKEERGSATEKCE